MNELTPEQKNEKWFVEVLGWKRGEIKYSVDRGQYSSDEQSEGWIDGDGKPWMSKLSEYPNRELPQLHLEYEGLGLQEKWVWPELRKIKLYSSTFEEPRKAGDNYICVIDHLGKNYIGITSTKATAQLTAALKAMGKYC